MDRTLTAPGTQASAAPPSGLPTVDPRLYAIGAEIAHGGMGRIRTATDLRLGREVALKELLEPRPELGARFEREALVTARLQHPAIVAVYEAGRWPSGEPFFAMKLVQGRPLKHVIAEATTFDARLALLPHAIAVADAMAYAHGHQIVHRDLKPANVLVGENGETVVIDWGIAKDLRVGDEPNLPGTRRVADASLTTAGSVMGTPQYMPPEQARGEVVDERADVYAIGAMLYHLLAGVPPYDGDDSRQVLARVAAAPPPPLAGIAIGIAPDLLAIVDIAMARDPRDRYPTARELAAELRRFQTGQLVASHRYTRAQLLRRFVARHRVALAIAAVAAIVVAVGAVISVQQIRGERDVARAERGRADTERAAAVARLDALIIEKADVAVERDDPTTAIAALAALSPGSAELARARIVAAAASAAHVPVVLRDLAEDIDDVGVSPDGAQLAISAGHEVRVIDLATRATRVVTRHAGVATRVVWSPDGKRLASAAFDGSVRISDLAPPRELLLSHTISIDDLAFTPDGARLVTVDLDDRLQVWSVATGKLETEITGARQMRAVGPHALVWLADAAHVRDLETGRERTVAFGAASRIDIARDGANLAVGRADGTVALVDLATGATRELGKLGAEPIDDLAIAPGGATVIALAGHQVRAWQASDGAVIVSATIESAADIQVSPDGHLFTAGPQLWDLETRDGTPLGVTSTTWRFSPDSSRVLALAGRDVWSWPTRVDVRAVAPLDGAAHQVAYLADGRLVAVGETRILVAGAAPVELPVALVGQLALHGTRAAMLGMDGVARTIDLATGAIAPLPGVLEVAPRFTPSDPAMTKILGTETFWRVRRTARKTRDQYDWFAPLAFSPDGSHLAGAGTSGSAVAIWTLATGARIAAATGSGDVEQLAFSADGQTVFAASSDGRLRAIAVADGREHATELPDALEAVAVGPTGVVTASVDQRVRVGDRELFAFGDVATTLALDGGGLASGAQDGAIRYADLRGGPPLAVPGSHGAILALALGGGRLVAGDAAGGVLLYDLAARHGRTLAIHGTAIGSVALSPDGTHVAAARADGVVREWVDNVPGDEAALRAWLAARR